MNFSRRVFSVCHSFRSMCQSGRMKGFERCFKVEDTWRLKRIQIKLYEPHLGKEKPVMGNIEPLLGITKPAEGLNKPCQGNVNGRKSFAVEGFNVKMPFISQTYTKAVAISFRQSHTRIRNLSMRWLALMRRCAEFKVIAQAYWRYTQRFELFKR